MLVVPAPQSMHAMKGKGSSTRHGGAAGDLYGLSTVRLPFPLRPEDRCAGEAHTRAADELLWLDVEDDLLALVRLDARALIEPDHPVIGRSPYVGGYVVLPLLYPSAHRISPKHSLKRSTFGTFGADASSNAMPS